jgi:DNA-binding transcriptional ArsR family regulator
MSRTAQQRKQLPEQERLDRVFSALGNQTRRALLRRLQAAPAKITDLAEPFAMSLPAVSKHVRVLEQAGLVSRAIDGRVHLCSLEVGPLRHADQWLAHYRAFWERALESLARHVGNEPG